MDASAVIGFAGGIGLFLLGMKLITDGLRVAAGGALRRILAAATRSRLRGLGSGILITAGVQSSSAVIFATIGFVNAGLLNLTQSIGVVYGANVGTTLTSWLVALVGFHVNLPALALPLIALGMVLRVTAGHSRRGPLGEALAGFGLFFLGIDILRETFGDVGAMLAPTGVAGIGVLDMAMYFFAGLLLTVLMQSSSAALAVTLTAAAGGLVPLQAAAAMVVGANVGTTSTAVFAAIGATAPAQRVASAHVLFNVITAVVALAAMPLLLMVTQWVGQVLGAAGQVAILLAIYHTLTKVIGVGLMWAVTPRLVGWLEQQFVRRDAENRPRYLDATVMRTPSLALDALTLELQRIGREARTLVVLAVEGQGRADVLQHERKRIEGLCIATADFAGEMASTSGDPQLAEHIPEALRVGQYYLDIADRAVEFARLSDETPIEDAELRDRVAHHVRGSLDFLREAEVTGTEWSPTTIDQMQDRLEAEYRELKAMLLQAGSARRLRAPAMVAVLDRLSALRRIRDQAYKAAHYLHGLVGMHEARTEEAPVGEDVA